MDATSFGAIAAGIAGLLTAVFTYFTTRSRTNSELTLSERDAFNKEQATFRTELRGDIQRLRVDLETMRQEVLRQRRIIDSLEEEIDQYRRILREHGIPLPVRIPRSYEEKYVVKSADALQPLAADPGSGAAPG